MNKALVRLSGDDERCFIERILLKNRACEIAFWPQKSILEQKFDGLYCWLGYIRINNLSGRHFNEYLCRGHHKLVMEMFQSEMAIEVHEQELTEIYAIKNGGSV